MNSREILLQRHPDLADTIDELTGYKLLDENSQMIEQWEMDENGNLVEVTEREKLKEQIALEQAEIERLKQCCRKVNNENGTNKYTE